MNIYTNTKKTKKLIIVLILLILFNFCYPKSVRAGLVDDIIAAPAKIFWLMEEGVLVLLNNIFTSEDKHAERENNISDSGNITTKLKVYLTPETIIKGKFILFDANIFKNIEGNANEYYDYEKDGYVADGKIALRETISGWYYAVRNLSIVALLSVLVYVGIRMILSTIAQDKAKYKIMFKDWLVALCLVVVMHYMMISILNISSDITEALGSGENSDLIGSVTELIEGILSDGEEEAYTFTRDGKTYTLSDAYANILVLIGIIVYTFIFAVKYLKREFTIIFLVILGPVSCITYPIDKISDGKAQAFNKWFSEFLYQVIIQPFHLLLYIVLIGSAAELANENVIYALVCFAVMMPAEKFVKEMFGFKDKLGSPLGAFAGGAAMSQILNSMTKGGKGGSGNAGNGNNNSGGSELPARTKNAELPGNSEESTTHRLGDGNDNSSASASDSAETGNVNTTENAELDNPEGDVDTTDNPELDSPEGEIDTTENAELDSPEGDVDTTGNPELDSLEEKKQNWLQRGTSAVMDKHNTKLLQKYGTVKKGELAKKRAWRAAKGFGRLTGKTIKGAVTLGASAGGAILLGGIGAMFGQGGKMAALGAGLGSQFGKNIGKMGDNVASKVSDTGKTFFNAARDKDTAKDKYKTNANNIDMARRIVKDNNGGILGTGKEVDQELENMYYMEQRGVQNSQIEDAMDQYHKNLETMDDTTAMNTAIQSALFAQDYSRKDFNDPKKMQEAYNGLLRQYQAAGITDKNVADKHIKKIMIGAGAMKGVSNIALPSTNQTIDVPVNRESLNVQASLGLQNAQLNDRQVERMNNITLRLRDQGYTDEEIQLLAEDSAASGMTATQVINRFSTKMEFLENKGQQAHAAKILEKTGKEVNPENIREEMKDRLTIKETFDVRPQDVSHIRNEEIKRISSKTQVQAARDFAIKNKGQLGNSARMATEKQNLINQLKEGGSSSDKAVKDAENIIKLASQYEGVKQKPNKKKK